MAGNSLSDIAKDLGYRSGSEVTQAIKERFAYDARDLTTDDRESILYMEMARLDRLQLGLWESAVYGDPNSVNLVLKIIQIRMKITGVDQPDAQTGQHTVLVVGGNEQSYVERLKSMIDEPMAIESPHDD